MFKFFLSDGNGSVEFVPSSVDRGQRLLNSTSLFRSGVLNEVLSLSIEREIVLKLDFKSKNQSRAKQKQNEIKSSHKRLI